MLSVKLVSLMSFLDKTTFETVIENSPLISIDLLVENSKGEYLLGYRNNRPAQGFWFVPGGRILKNEAIDEAFRRLTLKELGVKFERSSAMFLGPYEHFYDDFVFGEGVTTHYVVLGYKLQLDVVLTSLPSEQHAKYKWLTRSEMLASSNVHVHSKWYVE